MNVLRREIVRMFGREGEMENSINNIKTCPPLMFEGIFHQFVDCPTQGRLEFVAN